jgi:hypothetical protein
MGTQSQWLIGRHLQESRTRALGVLALFAAVQIADAWLTASGVTRFGMAAEGNPMLALPMSVFGPAATLTIAKGVAILGAVMLYRLSRHALLALLTVVYVFVAVVPWVWALGIS